MILQAPSRTDIICLRGRVRGTTQVRRDIRRLGHLTSLTLSSCGSVSVIYRGCFGMFTMRFGLGEPGYQSTSHVWLQEVVRCYGLQLVSRKPDPSSCSEACRPPLAGP